MKILKQCAILVLGLLVFLNHGDPCFGGNKPVVGVKVNLKERTYTQEFSASQEAAIEASAAVIIARQLSRKTAFLVFSPEISFDWVLTVDINRKDPKAEGDLNEIGFHISLEGPGADSLKEAYWTFHTIDEFNDVPFIVDAFLADIDKTLNKVDYAAVIREILSQIPIAKAAEMFDDTIFMGWKIHDFRHIDLCMNEKSELIVESAVPHGDTEKLWKITTTVTRPAVADWVNETISTEIVDDRYAEKVRKLLERLSQENLNVRNIYVNKYILLHQCAEAVAPGDAGFN
jgi:hypothetical protein